MNRRLPKSRLAERLIKMTNTSPDITPGIKAVMEYFLLGNFDGAKWVFDNLSPVEQHALLGAFDNVEEEKRTRNPNATH